MTAGTLRTFYGHFTTLLLLAAVFSSAIHAQVSEFLDEGGSEITVDAESIAYERGDELISASGDVVIRRGDTVLRADEVRLNRLTSEADAIGHASITTADDVIHASAIHFNLENETGWLTDAEIHSATLGYSLWGERVEKLPGHHYRLENGRFTTCQCDEGSPEWSVTGDEVDVTLDGYADIRGGSFNILDFPVLPIFRAKLPVNRERQSGLLLPRVGISNRRGFQLIQPYYWAINRSQDATFRLDIETAARIGILAEYRYALSDTFRGEIDASYFNEAIRTDSDTASTSRRSDITPPENRWGGSATHRQQLGPVEAYADVLVVGDDLFLREMNVFSIDYAQDTALRTLPFTTSRAGFLQQWERVTLQGEATVYQDLVGRPSLALQRVPEIRLSGQKMLGFNLVGRLNSSMTNFQRSRGITGVRFDILPALELKLPLGRFLLGSIQAEVRETAYLLTEDEMNCGLDGIDCVGVNGALASEEFDIEIDQNPIHLDSTSTREIFQVRGTLGTSFERIFPFGRFGIERLKHTIEPHLEYLFVPNVSQGDLPVFDTIDRINRRNLIYYGFASRLLARDAPDDLGETGEIYELMRFSLMQAYDASREIRGVGLDGPANHFSDIDFGLRINPNRRSAVRFRSSFDTTTTDLSFASVGVRIRDPFGLAEADATRRLVTETIVDLDYRFVRNNETAPEFPTNIQQLDAGIMLRLTQRVGFLYATRYDVKNNTFLENHFGLRLLSACDCWSIDLGVTDKTNPNELAVRAQLTLAGLGSAGTGSAFGNR